MTRLRPARREDKPALDAIHRRASLLREDTRAWLEARPELFDLDPALIDAGRVIVAEVDGAPAGFAVVTAVEHGEAELDGLFVEPDRHGRGLGRRLTAAALDLARRDGARAVRVVAGPDAAAFYARLGFADVGPAEVAFGAARTLRLDLTGR